MFIQFLLQHKHFKNIHDNIYMYIDGYFFKKMLQNYVYTYENDNSHLISWYHMDICYKAYLVLICSTQGDRCDSTCRNTPPDTGTASDSLTQRNEFCNLDDQDHHLLYPSCRSDSYLIKNGIKIFINNYTVYKMYIHIPYKSYINISTCISTIL